MRKWLIISLVCGACGASRADLDEELDGGGKADDPVRVEHGSYAPGDTAEASFTASARKHAWTFRLTAEAHLTIYTRPTSRDTILYLFQRNDDGSWGHYIAKNDDFADEPWSQIIRDLDPGEYRILVTAGDDDVRGAFSLKSRCSGDGCAAEPMDQVDAGDCIGQARECAFDGLDGDLTRTQARALLGECLAGKTGESTGAACEDACAYEYAEELCDATAEAIAFYSEQSATCRNLYTRCLPDCFASENDIQIYTDVWSTREGICSEYGGVSDCDRWARSRSSCGGTGVNGDCMDRCRATEGAWIGEDSADDAEAQCEERCAE